MAAGWNESNFYMGTEANWTWVPFYVYPESRGGYNLTDDEAQDMLDDGIVVENPEYPSGTPDYYSGSGSRYWYANDGVYRVSDHWGSNVGSCDWQLLDYEHENASNSWRDDAGERCGFCRWDDFDFNFMSPIAIIKDDDIGDVSGYIEVEIDPSMLGDGMVHFDGYSGLYYSDDCEGVIYVPSDYFAYLVDSGVGDYYQGARGASAIPDAYRGGNCFETAWDMLMDSVDYNLKSDLLICHGVLDGPIDGYVFTHGWNETGNGATCFDFSNGNEICMNRDMYYSVMGVHPETVHRYDYSDAYAEAQRTMKYGPWADELQFEYKEAAMSQTKTSFDVPIENTGGDCFVVAVENMMDDGPGGDMLLAHGIVSGQGALSGIRFVHAWNEFPSGYVLDDSNGNNILMPVSQYYAIGDIDQEEVYLYDFEEMGRKILEFGTYGPWESELMFDYKEAGMKRRAMDWRYDVDDYYYMYGVINDDWWTEVPDDGSYLICLDDDIVAVEKNMLGEWECNAYDEGRFVAEYAVGCKTPQEAVDVANSNINWIGDNSLPRLAANASKRGSWDISEFKDYTIYADQFSGVEAWVENIDVDGGFGWGVFDNGSSVAFGNERSIDEARSVAIGVAQRCIDGMPLGYDSYSDKFFDTSLEERMITSRVASCDIDWDEEYDGSIWSNVMLPGSGGVVQCHVDPTGGYCTWGVYAEDADIEVDGGFCNDVDEGMVFCQRVVDELYDAFSDDDFSYMGSFRKNSGSANCLVSFYTDLISSESLVDKVVVSYGDERSNYRYWVSHWPDGVDFIVGSNHSTLDEQWVLALTDDERAVLLREDWAGGDYDFGYVRYAKTSALEVYRDSYEAFEVGDMFYYDLSGDSNKYWEVVDIDYDNGELLMKSHDGETQWFTADYIADDLANENFFRVGSRVSSIGYDSDGAEIRIGDTLLNSDTGVRFKITDVLYDGGEKVFVGYDESDPRDEMELNESDMRAMRLIKTSSTDDWRVGDVFDRYDTVGNFVGKYEVLDVKRMSWRDSDGVFCDSTSYFVRNIDTGDTRWLDSGFVMNGIDAFPVVAKTASTTSASFGDSSTSAWYEIDGGLRLLVDIAHDGRWCWVVYAPVLSDWPAPFDEPNYIDEQASGWGFGSKDEALADFVNHGGYGDVSAQLHSKTATRQFTYAEMEELDREIEGRELHNRSRLKAFAEEALW